MWMSTPHISDYCTCFVYCTVSCSLVLFSLSGCIHNFLFSTFSCFSVKYNQQRNFTSCTNEITTLFSSAHACNASMYVDVEVFYWIIENFDLLGVQVKGKVSRSHPLGTMNLCTKFDVNPSNCCWDISSWTKVADRPTNRQTLPFWDIHEFVWLSRKTKDPQISNCPLKSYYLKPGASCTIVRILCKKI